jgi:hypothetical protein
MKLLRIKPPVKQLESLRTKKSLEAFRAFAYANSHAAAAWLIQKVAGQKHAKPKDFKFLAILRGSRPQITFPEIYCKVLSETPELRQQLPKSEQELFWTTKLKLNKKMLVDGTITEAILHSSTFREKGLFQDEMETALKVVLSFPASPLTRIALAHLLTVFRHQEIGGLIAETTYAPQTNGSQSQIYSKRFKVPHDLAHKFNSRPSYNICPNAEREFKSHHHNHHLVLLDNAILYDRSNRFGLCLINFLNNEGQVFISGVMYGTNSFNHREIVTAKKREEFPWQPLRAWNSLHNRFSPLDLFRGEYL